jgi:hypothetical protein
MDETRQKSIAIMKEASEKGLYPSLVAQLQKDFDRANVGGQFNEGLGPGELSAILHEKIYVLIMERFSDYLNLLYFVDVPEKAFKELSLTDIVDAAGEMAYLIVQREWQKVLLKANPGTL